MKLAQPSPLISSLPSGIILAKKKQREEESKAAGLGRSPKHN